MRGLGEAAGFVLRSRFSPRMKREAMQISKMAVSVCWSRSFLVPFVIDQTGEAAGDKKSTRSDGCGEKWDQLFTVCVHPTNDSSVALADSVNGRVG
jgi:hypothetical protein